MYKNKGKGKTAPTLVKAKLSNKQKKEKRDTIPYTLSDVTDIFASVNKHKEFLKFTLHNQRMVTKKVERIVSYDIDLDYDIVAVKDKVEERLLLKKLVLYPEAIPYLFNLEGCPKKLFLFLLLFRQRREDEFLFNSSVISLFMQFCEIYPPLYGEDTVKQAMKH